MLQTVGSCSRCSCMHWLAVRHRARAPDSRQASSSNALLSAAPQSTSTRDSSTALSGSLSPVPSSQLLSPDRERELELKAFKRDAAVLNELLRPPAPRRSGRPVRSASSASQGGSGGPALMSAHVPAGAHGQGAGAGGLMSPQPGRVLQIWILLLKYVRSLSAVVPIVCYCLLLLLLLPQHVTLNDVDRRGGSISGETCHGSHRRGSLCRPRLRVG